MTDNSFSSNIDDSDDDNPQLHEEESEFVFSPESDEVVDEGFDAFDEDDFDDEFDDDFEEEIDGEYDLEDDQYGVEFNQEFGHLTIEISDDVVDSDEGGPGEVEVEPD